MKTRQQMMAGFLLVLFALAASGCFSSSSSGSSDDEAGDGDPSPMAEVRAYHASPDAGPVDVYVNGDLVLEEVAFPAASPYLEVPAAELTVQITPAGEAPDNAVIEETVSPAEGGRYTFIVWGSVEAENLTATVIDDANEGVADGFVKIRPAHLAVGAPEVDLYVTSVDESLEDAEPVVAGLEFGDIADAYIEARAETSRLRVTVADSTDVVYDYVADLPSFEGASLLAAAVNAEEGFSPILIGAASDVSSLPFLPLLDQQSEVRVAHGSTDAGPVDVEVRREGAEDWAVLVEGLEYFNQTGYVRILGNLDYEVRVINEDGNIVEELELSPDAGNAYTVYALGSVSDGNLVFQTSVDRTGPVEGDDFAVRAVHGIIGGPTVDVTAEGDVLLEALPEGEVSDFAEAPAGEYEIEVVTNDGGDNVIGPLDVEFSAGHVYTAVALPEDEEGNEENNLWLIVDREAE